MLFELFVLVSILSEKKEQKTAMKIMCVSNESLNESADFHYISSTSNRQRTDSLGQN